MKFKRLWDLINIEGGVLTVYQGRRKEQLYLGALNFKHGYRVYCKTNDIVLEMFLHGRISLKEMFQIRGDEPYFIEKNKKIEEVFIEEIKVSPILDSLEFANSHYYTLGRGSTHSDPFSKINKIREEWAYGLRYAEPDITCEDEYLRENDIEFS